MNFFSTDGYLETLAQVYFTGKRARPQLFRTAGRVFRLLVVNGRPITTWPFLDFVQPLGAMPEGPVEELGYLPRAVRETTLAEERRETPDVMPSPYIDWSLFPDWATFEAMVGKRIGNLFPDSRRRKKKVERDLGPLRFVFDDPRPQVFAQCIRWKSSQYIATGLQDMFARAENIDLFRTLHRRALLVVSTLSAGSTLLAVHLGALADNRHYWWVPAYDPALSKYSPGRLMLEAILVESHQRRHREFDFLIGDEGYKWHYATHNRVIGPLGEPPLFLRVRTDAEARLKRALGRYPKLMVAAKSLKKRLQAP